MAFVSLLLVTQSFGQAISVNGGSISGSVMDTSGAAVPAAQVKITGTDTGSVKVVTTDSSGLYSVGPLEPRQLPIGDRCLGFSDDKCQDCGANWNRNQWRCQAKSWVVRGND